VLKLKFQRLHKTLVESLDVYCINIIQSLFGEAVIGVRHLTELGNVNDAKQQSNNLLILLHTSKHPQAFIRLYLAINEEPELQWMIKMIDNINGHTLIAQQYSEPTGE